ncbi:hypothetical protein F2P79_025020 [Pimephales promelas]|nr:hypothetical protein F2P79_025020 [Pimephales promelas]
MKDTNARITRWFLALQPFDFEVVYRTGSENCTADFLSRTPRVVSGEGGGNVTGCPAAPPGVIQDNLHDYRQDLDAIHTQYMTKVFWDPQWKASRREMLAGQMYLYTTPTSAFTWMADYYHVL